MGLHRSIGLTILGLAILRVLWRLIDRRPAWPATMAAYERVVARATHLIFHVLLFALSVTGWLKHHVWDRDHVLRSMLPGRRAKLRG